MTAFRRRVASYTIFAVGMLFNGTLVISTAIGLTTAPDDLANLPRFVQWLVSTPWWVPAIVIPIIILTFAMWIFGTDKSVDKALQDYKSANQRAWAFEPEFRDRMIAFDNEAVAFRELGEKLSIDYENFRSRLEGIEAEFMEKFGVIAAGQAKFRLEHEAGELRRNVQTQIIGAIQENGVPPLRILNERMDQIDNRMKLLELIVQNRQN